MLYMDTVCYNPPAAKMVLEWLDPIMCSTAATRRRSFAQAARDQVVRTWTFRRRQGEDF